jgi:hypothetical protein
MKRTLIPSLLAFTGVLALPQAVPALEGLTVVHWAEEAMQAVRTQNVSTPDAARLYAMVTLAMYDAVNGIDTASRRGRAPALVPAAGAPINGDRVTSAASAAHSILTALFPGNSRTFDAALAVDLMKFENAKASIAAGRRWGQYVGQQVLTKRSADGTQAPAMMPAGRNPGLHRAPFDARWRHMMPFGIASKARYLSGPPPALTSATYTASMEEAQRMGKQDCDSHRNEIAQFWLAEAGTARETGLWLQAAIAIARQQGTLQSVSDTVRLLALVGMAVADAVIVSWETKATYFTWRPTVAIREADTDGNPATPADPIWLSRIGSPGGSPEYNSGTATFGGAAARVIEQFFCGTKLSFCFETEGSINGPRCYSSPSDAAVEAGRSRVIQGIHFQFSVEDGQQAGRAIGEEISNTRLKPLGAPAQAQCRE